MERVATGSVDDISDAKAKAVPGLGQDTVDDITPALLTITGIYRNSHSLGSFRQCRI